MNILVVDDNVDSSDMLVVLLRRMGHSADAVNESSLALSVAREAAPDIVVLDLGMPGMDGFELAQKLRSDPITRDIRLIALTGHVFPAHRAATQAAGIDFHLAKPVTMDALRAALG